MERLQLEIISPQEVVYSGEATKVVLPGKLAPFTILPQHAPIVSSLSKGRLTYTKAGEGEEEVGIDIQGGFMEMNNNHVTVCVEIISAGEEESPADAAEKEVKEENKEEEAKKDE